MKIFSRTTALCPECNVKTDARIIEDEGAIFLEKLCVTHGNSRALICSDAKWYADSLHFLKPGTPPKSRSVQEYNGCSDSCGLCPSHKQHTCLPVIEINTECDLNCPVCLKNERKDFSLTSQEFTSIIDTLQKCEDSVEVINISGGEPLLHPELETFIGIANDKGILQTTVSTNGLQLLKNSELRQMIKETGTLIALQFDGFLPETWKRLRGIDLSEQKLEIISLMEEEGIRYSLVATIEKNINENEVEDITDFFFKSQALSLMFQPASFTGNAHSMGDPLQRTTIPDVIAGAERSSFINSGDFIPLPCCHATCFALSYYLKADDTTYVNMKEFLGTDRYIDSIANRTLPGLDAESYQTIMARIYDMWSAQDQFSTDTLIMDRIRSILRKLNQSGFSSKAAFDIGRESVKAVFIHQFMDRHTFDFGRVIKCCNHYPTANGKLIPMCAANVLGRE